MKRFILGFLVGLLLGVGGYWYLREVRQEDPVQAAKTGVVAGTEKVKQTIQDAVSEINLEDIKAELARGGLVVREKAKRAGAAVADAATNARITATIKTKLLTEPGLSGLSINVDTTDGFVTLSGTVSSADQVARAVRIALDTEGVYKVASTLQVKPAQ
jgi:hyperosmotically inducible protein